MAKVRMSQKLQVHRYEPLEISVEVDSDDIPREENESIKSHISKLHDRAYKEILAFRVFHKDMSLEQSKADYLKFRKMYGLESKAHTNGHKPVEAS